MHLLNSMLCRCVLALCAYCAHAEARTYAHTTQIFINIAFCLMARTTKTDYAYDDDYYYICAGEIIVAHFICQYKV